MEVHSILGPGHPEAVYHEAMEIEMSLRNIPFTSEPKLEIYYKDNKLQKYYVPDFIVYEGVVVEIKARSGIREIDRAQIINSLTCARKRIGLLLNFGEVSLKRERFINSRNL